MGIDYTKRPKGGVTAAPPSGPVSLTKRGETVNMVKGSSGAPVRLNLNWNQRPAGGFFKRLAPGIDLDLGCLWELRDGRRGVVQALGNMFGAIDEPPYVQLDKDDRSGRATDGENLFVSGWHSADIKRLAVFAFIYEGVTRWSQADGVVTIHPPEGAPVTIELDERGDGSPMCAVCVITGNTTGFTIERRVQYVSGHIELDQLFGWNLSWRAGRK